MRFFARAFLVEGASPADSKRLLADANPGSIVQTAKGGLARNERLVELLAAQTLQAEASGALLANKPEIDLLLRMAGTTQISRAIRDAGAKPGDPFLAIVVGKRALRRPPRFKGTELPKRELDGFELGMVEKAALLNASRA